MTYETHARMETLLATTGFRTYAQEMVRRWPRERAVAEIAKNFGTTKAAVRAALVYVV